MFEKDKQNFKRLHFKKKFMKKTILFLFTIILTSGISKSQEWMNAISGSNDANFYVIQKDFNSFWDGKEIQRSQGWKQFKRWEEFMSPRVFPDGNLPNPMATFYALKRNNTFRNNQNYGNWLSLGPNTPVTHGIGRINFITFHPNDTNIIYVGAPSGGLWKSTNAGLNWTTNTDNLPVIGFTDLVINPINPNTMYLASSDGDAGDTYSIGVLKSTNGGKTWEKSGLDWEVSYARRISKLLMHPDDTNTLIAATSNGIYKTTNGGNTWDKEKSGNFRDIEFKPGNPKTIYAGTYGYSSAEFYVSNDGGDNFTEIISGLPGDSSNRYAIAVTPADTDLVYILASRGSNPGRHGFNGFYKSTDAGQNFTMMSSSPNILGWAVNGDDDGGQGFYDLDVIASKTNKDIVYTGGVNIYKSYDGGATWELNAHWWGGGGKPYVHADIHALEFVPGSETLFVGSDGGPFKTSDNGKSYVDLSNTLVISQIYRLGLSKNDPNKYVIGLQDCGTKLKKNTWGNIIGGDGMECLIDPANDDIIYGSLYYGNIRRSTNGGDDFTEVGGKDINGIDESGGWITPFVLSPKNNQTIYAGYKNIWRTNNRGDLWFKISDFNDVNEVEVVAVSEKDTATIYTVIRQKSNNRTAIMKTSNSGDVWTDVTGSLPVSSATITDLKVYPKNPDIVWVSFSGYSTGNKVYITKDGGQTWTNISGSLPNIPANCLVFQNNSYFGIYVGMDVGVYYIDSTMTDWVSFNNQLPNVIVNEMEIFYNPTDTTKHKLRAATYGRGLWESELYFPPTIAPVADFSTETTTVCEGFAVQFTNSSSYATGFEWTFEGGEPSKSTDREPVVYFKNAGQFDVKLKVTNDFGVDSVIKTDYITVDGSLPCVYVMPNDISGIIYKSCKGKLYDPGGYENYPNNTDVYVTISPFEATGLILTFDSFSFENNFDFLYIYEGNSIGGNLIGKYTGNSLPNDGMLIIPSGSVTIRMSSDEFSNARGFVMNWECITVNDPPFASFSVDKMTSCNGMVTFTDQSFNNPTEYDWSFGDGETSDKQNPVHYYSKNGKYNVRLIVSNNNGSDTFEITGIEVNTPEMPNVRNGSSCGTGSVTLKAVGSRIKWFDAETGGNQVGEGLTYFTNSLSSTTSFYAQSFDDGAVQEVGANFTGTGNGTYSNNEHYLTFDVLEDMIFESFDIYASGTRQRRFLIKDENSNIVLDTLLLTPNGLSTINIMKYMPSGNNYTISASNANLFYLNQGVKFPYQINNLVNIKSGSDGDNKYHYFFDWKVKKIDECYSKRKEVIAYILNSAPTADFDYIDSSLTYHFNNLSTDAANWAWRFGDGDSNIYDKNPVHNYMQTGEYIVTLEVYNDCGDDQVSKTINVVNSISEAPEDFIKIYPNPNSGRLVVTVPNELFNIRVIDVNGQVIYQDLNIQLSKPKNGADNRLVINLGKQASGVYFLQLTTEKYLVSKKFFIK
jgi:PKD repeat protein